ncbi:type IV toxin-antitoxin system AbiEi family antitoxin domain-containing protein [Knoellia sp. Soil729]|uniref:type IV toxin-antitoxin system AbiEi family antitoxin domain-containing protein n=1 Tax=Knoellia sp. Soil729 TaxID=1736394 RepID=UPI0006FA56B8|nr:type IV toxin-antitoxin system AbiEi family antitoxin domain-containing protein [Knoellia sp. Soil729]KRE41590.1 hypothetical protein ASG74_13825 [Knoellia sp. Soil729]
MDLDPHLVALAQEQGGLFTTAQAHQFGLSRTWLRELVRGRTVLHPTRGLYAVASLVDTRPLAWHLTLARGAHLLYEDAQLTGVTAVLAHGVPVWNCRLDRPELRRPITHQVGVKPFRVRPGGGVSTSVESPYGPTVPLADALVQLAMDHGIVQGVVSADAALHSGQVSMAELEAAVERVATWPRSSRARAMRDLVDPACESVAESRARVEFVTHGIQVESQVVIRRADGKVVGRADFRVKGTNVIIEVDGKMKYADGDGEVLWAEKRRVDEMRSLGHLFVRVTWSHLETPGRASAMVRRALPHTASGGRISPEVERSAGNGSGLNAPLP